MTSKINNKLIAYTSEIETYLIGLGFQPLSDRDREYVEKFPVIVIENGRLIAPAHWHYGLDEIFFVDGCLIYEGAEYLQIVNVKVDEWNSDVIKALQGESLSEADLALVL